MKIILRRRKFLEAVGYGALVPALVPPPSLDAARIGSLESILTAAPAQNRRISFEEAQADKENRKGLRQKYIDQVVGEELGDEAQLFINNFALVDDILLTISFPNRKISFCNFG